jgi:hypothetical protein
MRPGQGGCCSFGTAETDTQTIRVACSRQAGMRFLNNTVCARKSLSEVESNVDSRQRSDASPAVRPTWSEGLPSQGEPTKSSEQQSATA